MKKLPFDLTTLPINKNIVTFTEFKFLIIWKLVKGLGKQHILVMARNLYLSSIYQRQSQIIRLTFKIIS